MPKVEFARERVKIRIPNVAKEVLIRERERYQEPSFALRVPNAETEAAMRECEEMLASGNYRRYSSTKEMFADIFAGEDDDDDV